LLGAARATGTLHLVYVSIVGVDRVPYRYYRAKLEAERLIQGSGLPWTILRATQFHQLVLLVARGLARLPVVPVPAATSVQPIDAAEVADRLASLAAGPPAGRVADLGGPQIWPAAELLRACLDAAGRRRPALPVRLPGAVFAGYRRGGHLAPDRAMGRRTWEEFGGMNLAMAVVFGVAAVTLDRRLATTALVAYLVFALPHLIFHLGHLEPFGAVDAVAQVVTLVVAALLPLPLLALFHRAPLVHRIHRRRP
jgi:uncharacterized protein YbjT (DUF2867 family)